MEEKPENGDESITRDAVRARPKPGSLQRDPDYLEAVTAIEIDGKWEDEYASDLSKDITLSRISSKEVEAEMLFADIRQELRIGAHPPKESVMQGRYRENIAGDRRRSLGASDVKEMMTAASKYRLGLKRSIGGWQQKKLDRVLSVGRHESSDEKRSLKERIFG